MNVITQDKNMAPRAVFNKVSAGSLVKIAADIRQRGMEAKVVQSEIR